MSLKNINVFEKESQRDLLYKLLSSSKVCVVTFSASWCKPCKSLSTSLDTELENIKDKLLTPASNPDTDIQTKISFCKIDIDVFNDLCSVYKVTSIPHTVFFKNGQLDSEIIKGNDATQIINKVNKL
jgi:thioredoxin 1